MSNRGFLGVFVLLGVGATAPMLDGSQVTAALASGERRQMVSRNASGLLRTINLNAGPDVENPFFQEHRRPLPTTNIGFLTAVMWGGPVQCPVARRPGRWAERARRAWRT